MNIDFRCLLYKNILHFSYSKDINIILMNHREITKKYSELLNSVQYANGRKEVVGLLKKAAKLKSKIEIN